MVCAEFEYDNIPGARALVQARVKPLLASLATGGISTAAEAQDGGTTHQKMFVGLCPPQHPRYVGNYRGDQNCPCLHTYEVTAAGDPRLGAPAREVDARMGDFSTKVGTALGLLDQLPKSPARVYVVVKVAARLFEEFLCIHPYANGNGHMARWLVCVVLARYGYPPKNWTVDPRPSGPYLAAILRARDADFQPLEAFLLERIVG